MQIKELSDRVDNASLGGGCYVLTCVISAVTDWRQSPKTHLVSQIRGTRGLTMHMIHSDIVKPSTHPKEISDIRDQCWFLFNDFGVTPVSKFQSIYINHHWKARGAILMNEGLTCLRFPAFSTTQRSNTWHYLLLRSTCHWGIESSPKRTHSLDPMDFLRPHCHSSHCNRMNSNI